MTRQPDPAGHCGADHCITCADEGVPMRVSRLDAASGLAVCVDEAGRPATIETGLVAELAAGDTVLVHAGVALVRLTPQEAPA
ncbi:MAG TPA: HypC/HybG/HupF family hydrogenase formation chaperone [Solirubrobacteraceae bacterium]|jgi:hydrogenase maturation factor|nr:HypC/HybG/HupF family hydrogenase formation chaperone [Solirubrobacteraceae bacterium]